MVSPTVCVLLLLGRFHSEKQGKSFNSSCQIIRVAVPASTGLYSTVFCLMLKLWFPRAVSKGLNPLCQALPTCIQSVYSLYLWPVGFPEHRTGFTGTVGSQEWGETCATCGGGLQSLFFNSKSDRSCPKDEVEESLICGSCQDRNMKKVLHLHHCRAWAKSCMTGSGM